MLMKESSECKRNLFFVFSSRRRHTRLQGDWSSDVCSSDLIVPVERTPGVLRLPQPQPLLQQAGSKGAPAISPDGRWVAYSSAASADFEVFVMPLSPQRRAAGRKWLVSNGGGHSPIWSRNGRQLFY